MGVTPSSMTSVVPSNPALTAETPEGCQRECQRESVRKSQGVSERVSESVRESVRQCQRECQRVSEGGQRECQKECQRECPREGCAHRLRAPRGRGGGEQEGDGVTQVGKEDLSCRLRASLDPQAACPLPDHTGAVGQSFLNPSAHSRDTFAFGVRGLGRDRESSLLTTYWSEST